MKSKINDSILGLFFFLGLISINLYAAELAGKAVIVKGQIDRVAKDGSKARIKEGASVFEGDTITSARDSSAKIVLKDETEMSLGPDSKFIVEDFNAQKTSVFSVVMGQLRAKVTKSVSNETKVLVRTRGATMGVRGTDFETIYNPQTGMTSLVTFEGAVAMAKSDPGSAAALPSTAQLLSSLQDASKVVLVTQGQFSGVPLAATQPTVPVKISPAQLESLKNSSVVSTTNSGATNSGAATSTTSAGKNLISPIPPGVDAKLLVGSVSEMRQAIEATGVGGMNLNSTAKTDSPSTPPPEGFFDRNSGKMAPPAGGFVDMKTGLYIPPPPGSSFDPIAGVYVPPPSMGSFSPETGSYVPPKGLVLDASRGFVTEAAARTLSPNTTTAAASTMAGQPPVPGGGPQGALGGAGMLPGMDPSMFGAGMVAAPPPPGTGPAGTMPGPMMAGGFGGALPGAGFSGGLYGVGPPPGATAYPNYDGLQPQYPVYNPFLCPPYCDPYAQPGTLPPPPAAGTTSTVTFTIN